MMMLVRLLRVRLAVMNGVATMAGYLLFPGNREMVAAWLACCGVGLLAAGGSALNQVMERDLDRLMERTRLRPLPQGELSVAAATGIAAVLVSAGIMLLLKAGGVLPAVLGSAALVWYLGVYTPLKRRTGLALPIGALCGAVPPLIGWCVAGGSPGDPRIMVLSGVLFLWQMPHFWLVQRRHRQDYPADAAFLPSLPGNGEQLSPLFGLWLLALLAAALLLPAFGLLNGPAALCYPILPLVLIPLVLLRRERALRGVLNLFPLLLTMTILWEAGF
ncbi:protoheme IX farnesyltransferase [Pelotalea chapellei]|uniref:protoheme IX farnesyltransferase n=1 Tax=Pelotalea chapellei TaxID=44671 RepID=UPI001FE541DA|nr:protoheme IX farnesyltransferase [Pelotalea chapellei]